MESTGVRGRIQVSKMTAELLSQAGKSHWVRPRDDAVTAKGKGVLKTFWLNPSFQRASSTASSESDLNGASNVSAPEIVPKDKMYLMKQERLVGWMVEILVDHIKSIVSCISEPSSGKLAFLSGTLIFIFISIRFAYARTYMGGRALPLAKRFSTIGQKGRIVLTK